MRGGARLAAAALAAWLLLLPGCAVGPDYVAPQPELPDLWFQDLRRGVVEGEASLKTWWTFLADPLLTKLIDRATAGSLDLRLATARVFEARAQRGIAVGDWFPGVLGGGSVSRNRVSRALTPPTLAPKRTSTLYSVGIDSSWEIDFFGRIRRSVESADAGWQASIEDYRDALVVLYAEVGLAYVEARALQARIRYAESNVGTQRRSLEVTVDRNRAGLVGDLDVRQAELNLATTEAFIPQLRSALASTLNRLSVLLGEIPGPLRAELAAQAPIPAAPDQVVVGLPVNLLRQRPDLRAAERRVAEQTARIGVATADLYPRFALLGTFAFSTTDAARLFTGQAWNWSVGPAFQWDIFDGGRVRSAIAAQDAVTEQALISYEQQVLSALEEVESALVNYEEERERRDALARSATAASEAVQLVSTLYRTGLTDFQNVLDTERSLFQQQDALAESEGNVTTNLIRLYKALGGGWDPGTP